MLRLKTLRKSRGLTLKELGELLGVKESAVSLYENAKREAPYAILHKLSEIFAVSIDYLLENGDESDSNSLNIPIIDSVLLSDEGVEYCYSGESFSLLLGNVDEHFFLKVCDGSMAPQICQNDIAIVKKQNEVDSGDIAAVIYKESPIMLRRIVIQNDVILLQAFDPNAASEIVESIDDLTILGKVVQTFKKW